MHTLALAPTCVRSTATPPSVPAPFSLLPPPAALRGIITVCAWCADKPQRDEEAAVAGYVVSHGICDTCKEKQLRDITAESFAPLTPRPAA